MGKIHGRTMNLKRKLMVIDGNSIMNRAFYGLLGPKMLSTSDGFYTNAIYGFLNILIKFLNDEKPDYLAVAFDMKAPTFRHKQYQGYKAQRKGMPDELAVQMPVLKEILDAMNIKRIEVEGYEADDVIGTLAKYAEKIGMKIVIVTGDRDALQLVSESIRVKIPTTKMGKTEVQDYDEEQISKLYGLKPHQFVEVKALMGDSSDNIPGIPGIGEKTALELIKKYGTIDNIYENIEKLELKERLKRLLIENKELAYLSKELAKIDVNIPIDIKIDEYKIKEYNYEVLFSLLKRLEFTSIINKLGLKKYGETAGDKVFSIESKCLVNQDELAAVKALIKASGEFAYFLLFNKKKFIDMEPVGVGLSWNEEAGAFIYLQDYKENSQVIGFLREIFTDKDLKKYTFNAKPHYIVFDSLGIDIEVVDFDVMIAGYLINPSRENYSISDLAREYCGVLMTGEEQLKTYQKNNYKGCDVKQVFPIVCEMSAMVFKLTKILKEIIHENNQDKLYFEVELPLTRVLADMEKNGVMVDKKALEQFSIELEKKIADLTNEIIELAGEDFNINSTRQLGHILFEKLKLPVVRMTKTGYSTDVEVLEVLAPKHPIIDKILEYRQMVKLKSTYVDGLIPLINPSTNRIHSNFNQTVTVTGRISSTEPNLQNIPIKYEMGKQIRKVFVAPEDCFLMDADYSQIELRVLAHISNDENMIQAFKNGEDIHRITAAQVFNVKEEEVTPLMRSRAKAINFGIVYGISDFGLAKDLRITKKQAKNYIDNYFKKYSGVKNYIYNTIENGRKQGYVTTLLGRRRYLPELYSKNFNIRSFGERVAVNMPVQGTAADIIKLAMVRVYNELKKRNLESKLILQVHDELVVETKKHELEEVRNVLKSCMENALELVVPLVVDIHWGNNWYETK